MKLPRPSPCSSPAPPSRTRRLAVFDFTLTNTSGFASSPDEAARLQRLDAQLRAALASRFTLVDTESTKPALAQVDSIRGCNGCELELARGSARSRSHTAGCRR